MAQRLDYSTVAADGMKALGGVYGYVAQSGLPKTLVDLVYLRVSQINGCAYCIDMHSRDLLKNGLAVEKLVLVPAWHEAGNPRFSSWLVATWVGSAGSQSRIVVSSGR
jgi:AhpD family alkylhydroperoxidase